MNLASEKSILFDVTLVDGSADGLIHIETKEFVCYKISKEYFEVYKNDSDIKSLKSVYVLYGKGKFYVGKSDLRIDGTAITSRIEEHLKNPDEDFIEEIVFFADKMNEWDGHINYLEALLIKYFKDNNFPLFKRQRDETIDESISGRKRGEYIKIFNAIITTLDMLGYNSIVKAINDYDKNRIEVTEENVPRTYGKVFFIKDKSDAKAYLEKIGYKKLGHVDTFSYSSLNKDGKYSMDVQMSLLEKDWTIVLNNDDERILRVFVIPVDVIKEYGIENFRDKSANNPEDKRKSISISKQDYNLSKIRGAQVDRLSIKSYEDFCVKY